MNPILKNDLVLKRFESPDEVRKIDNGRFEIVQINGVKIARAIYQPGWRWSVDVGARAGLSSCKDEHVLYVISGCLATSMDDGRVIEMHAGDVYYVPPGHDAWVVGDEPYVSLHVLSAGPI
jgi:mannose-6-phosphate isomerase-like protein (cupin superfamily)